MARTSPRRQPLLLAGPPRLRGRVHGEALKPLIARHVELLAEEIARAAGLSLAGYLARFAARTRFRAVAERLAPDLVDEVRGIAEGAGIDDGVCFWLQCMDQHWHQLGRLGPASAGSGCSCIGGMGGGGVLVGQNMDLPALAEGLQVLLRIEPGGGEPALLVPSLAGMIGLFGVGAHGVAVCVNSLSQLTSSPAGLPVAFIVRRLLARRSLEAAAFVLRSVPHASGQHYLLAGPSSRPGSGGGFALRSFECSARGVVPCVPAAGSVHCHTNHPLASEDLAGAFGGWDADRPAADRAHGLTFTRLDALVRGARAGALTAPTIERALEETAHRPGNPFDVVTVASAIFELGRRPSVRVACGPPGTPLAGYRLSPEDRGRAPSDPRRARPRSR